MTTSRVRSHCSASLVLLGALLTSACAGASAPDLVIRNARVFTNDPAQPWAEAVAIKGERIVAVGESAAIAATAGPSTRVIDAGGRVLVPGFNDARVDLPLEPPTAAALSALDGEAIAHGVTSLQVVAGGPMRTLVAAAQQATRQARWRLIRSPEDTTTLSTADATTIARFDEEPYLPPQPGARLVANGVAWRLGGGRPEGRRPITPERVSTVVGWAYGAEDPIVMSVEGRQWLTALTQVGVPTVWQRKRPRFDVDGPDDGDLIGDFVRLGVVVAWLPTAMPVRPPGPEPFSMPWHYPGIYLDGGVRLCLGSAGSPDPAGVIAVATGVGRRPGVRPLTREEAVRAMTWGSAYAEKAERDKGWLGPGTLADLAVLTDDVFTVPDDRLADIRSVLTLVGGAIVYDAGVLPR